MKKNITIAVVALLVGAAAMSLAQTVRPVDPFASFPAGTTYWTNERGSTLRIDSDGKGRLSGAFTTAVGCGVGVARPLAGAYSGNSVGFVVNFGAECPSVTSWNGVLLTGRQTTMKTLWYLTKGGIPSWDSTVAGADNFTRELDMAKVPAVIRPK